MIGAAIEQGQIVRIGVNRPRRPVVSRMTPILAIFQRRAGGREGDGAGDGLMVTIGLACTVVTRAPTELLGRGRRSLSMGVEHGEGSRAVAQPVRRSATPVEEPIQVSHVRPAGLCRSL
jgi:hypothetical protein